MPLKKKTYKNKACHPKAEDDQDMKDTIEDVVQLLIKKEEEIQVEDLHGVDVPKDVQDQFEAERSQMENLNVGGEDTNN